MSATTPGGDGKPNEPTAGDKPTPDDKMSEGEKTALVDQMEEFEGPDRREKRGTETPSKDDPGVAHS